MFARFWILKDDAPVLCRDPRVWAHWMMAADLKQARRVARTDVGDAYVSTVFLAVDHASGGTPILYETMVFGIDASYRKRYATRELACAGHKVAVAWQERKMGRTESARLIE